MEQTYAGKAFYQSQGKGLSIALNASLTTYLHYV